MKRVIDLTYKPSNTVHQSNLAKTETPSKSSDLKVKPNSIGEFCVNLIKTTSFSNNTIAQMAREKFNSKTSPACIAWYRNKMKGGR